MKPLTIVGGGLAGLSLGVALRLRGVPVDLHEAGSYPRHRVCGEFISGLSDRTIDTLGIGTSLSDCRRHLSTAWYLRDRKIFSGELPEPALAISRYLLDDRLRELFLSAGGQLFERSRVPLGSGPGVVRASGRRLEKGSEWLGLKAHFFDFPVSGGLEMHLGDRAYVGVTPIEGGRVNVCGLFRNLPPIEATGARRLIDAVRSTGMTALHDRLRSASADEVSFTGVSALRFGVQMPADETESCSIGDAQSLIPPFTGNGMTMAFQAAETALPFLLDYASGKVSWEASVSGIWKAQQGRFRRRLGVSRWLHPVLCSRAGQDSMAVLARVGLLPFHTLYRALR